MREIAADAPALVERFPRGSGVARMLIAKRDMVMHKIADCLHPAPARESLPEKIPRYVGELLGLAVAAAQEKNQRVLGQFLDGMLLRVRGNYIGLAGILDDCRVTYGELSGRSDEARAPVTVAIAISRKWNRRAGR